MYNINTDNIGDQYTPPAFKRTIFQAIIRVLLAPIKELATSFVGFVSVTDTKLSYNAKKYSIEKLLNNTFDNTLRRIYISSASSISMLIAYEQEDIQRRIILADAIDFDDYPVIAYENYEIGTNLHKFIVNVPDQVIFHDIEAQLIALTNRYKFDSKLFYIRYF